MRNQNTTTIVAVIIVILLVVNFNLFGKIVTDKVPKQDMEKIAQNAQPELSPQEQSKIQLQQQISQDFSEIPATFSSTKCGELVLVDALHAYDFDATTTLFATQKPECVVDKKSDTYLASDRTVLLNITTINALNNMLDDFAAQTGARDILIIDGYRTYEKQQGVLERKISQYGEEQGKLIAAAPGHSEHHSGYALDLGHTDYREYDGTGVYDWITKNCYKYGFVIRYPADKTAITGINYEPWHLRYVGRVHAEYMTKNNLCLEEYVQLLSGYTIDSARLQIETYDGGKYEVYTCPVEGDSGKIMVPKNYPYTLSGDNAGHIIVTVNKSENVA